MGDEKIEAALRAPADLDFTETPLQDAIDKIAEKHKINVVLDQRALDDVGIPSDCPITFRLSGVSLESALDLMLRDLDLTWTIHDDVLLITTPEEAESMLLARLYDVGDLVTCRDKSGELWADYDSLIEMLTSAVQPETWDNVGGPGSIAPAPLGGAQMLVIAQTYQIHRKIEQLLDQMRTIAQEKGSGEPPLREKPPAPPAMGSGLPMFGATGPPKLRKLSAPTQPPAGQPKERHPEEPEEALGIIPGAPAPGSVEGAAASATLSQARKTTLRAEYDTVDFRPMSRGELKIRSALDQPTEIDFIETPLADVVDNLASMYDIPIELDIRALDDVGIPADCPITRKLKGVPLRSALDLMLRDLDLTYVILDDVLLITTPAEADAMLQTRVYSLHRLPGFDSQTVAEVIQATIRPDTWRTEAPREKTASPAAASNQKTPRRGVVRALPGCLVITQSQRVHEEIAPLLAELERFKKSAEVLRKLSDE